MSLNDSSWCALDKASSLVSVSKLSFSISCLLSSEINSVDGGLELPSMVSEDLLDLIGEPGIKLLMCPLKAEAALAG